MDGMVWKLPGDTFKNVTALHLRLNHEMEHSGNKVFTLETTSRLHGKFDV